MSRPEHIAPPEIFYGDTEARKYTENSRITSIQAEMTYRALELLNLPEGQSAYILDIGCGSGLSGEILEEEGHIWVGMDIAPAMLDVAREREVEGDLFLQDAGQEYLNSRSESISVLQWLCNADKQINRPKARLQRFFSTLYASLRKGARAIFQFYPQNDDQIKLITEVATKCGFVGGLLIDYPDSKKAKKYYLCLMAGQTPDMQFTLPKALGGNGEVHPDEEKAVLYEKRRAASKKAPKKRKNVKDKEWIMRKKRIARERGDKPVANDSKYTGRKRRVQF